MSYNKLINLIDDMASSFLCLDGREIDVPAAGVFLNQLEVILNMARDLQLVPIKRVAGGLNVLLEKIILEGIDHEAGFYAFEKGITTMQEIVTSVDHTRQFDGSIDEYMAWLGELTGSDFQTENVSADTGSLHRDDAGEVFEPEGTFEVADESLLRDFITEGLEYIGEIEVNILNLEQAPDDKEYINAVFRPFHSIKGVASFLDLNEIRDLSHNLENLLDRARSGEIVIDSVLIDIILDGADALKAMIGSLHEVLEGTRNRPLELDTSDLKHRIVGIDRLVDDGCSIYEAGKEFGAVKKLGDILIEDGIISKEALEASLKTAQTPPPRKIGEALIKEGKVTPKQVSQALRKQSHQVTDTSTIRVDVKKLDDLIDMIGELVITQAMIRQNATVQSSTDRKLVGDISQLASITSELQRTSTSLRMIPIRQTFQRMARLVRDLAKNAGKRVAVEMTGEETEIDRNMVEEIYNPLVHMIRNSVDHGIEFPEDRIKYGKSEQGLIKLKAYHKGGNIVIEISDDGQGLKKDKIMNRAMEKGLIKSSDTLSEHEIYKLLFVPGFSTAEKVTDVSGRGVGMDVVKQAVEKLRGKIEVASIEGEGSTFMTYFPLTMAIIDGMIVRVGAEKYIIPATAIRQLLRPRSDAYNNVVGKGEMLNVMGNLLPLVRLHEVFDIKSDHEKPWDALVVVVEAENRSKCVLVDEVLGKEEVVIKGLGDGLKSIRGVSGGAILGDGNVGLILDPESLFALSEN